MQDIALVHELGVRLVLVVGCSKQVRRQTIGRWLFRFECSSHKAAPRLLPSADGGRRRLEDCTLTYGPVWRLPFSFHRTSPRACSLRLRPARSLSPPLAHASPRFETPNRSTRCLMSRAASPFSQRVSGSPTKRLWIWPWRAPPCAEARRSHPSAPLRGACIPSHRDVTDSMRKQTRPQMPLSLPPLPPTTAAGGRREGPARDLRPAVQGSFRVRHAQARTACAPNPRLRRPGHFRELRRGQAPRGCRRRRLRRDRRGARRSGTALRRSLLGCCFPPLVGSITVALPLAAATATGAMRSPARPLPSL